MGRNSVAIRDCGNLTAQSYVPEFLKDLSSGLGLIDPTPTPQPKTLKPKKRSAANTKAGQTSEGELSAPGTVSDLSEPLATTDFHLVGLIGTASPATQTVPKNIPTAINTSIQVPEGEDPTQIIAGLNPNFKIRGELVGPSFTSPRVIEASIGQPLPIPPLQNIGDHVINNLRIVDTSLADAPTIAPVVPDSCGITVIERVLISQVQVTEMTYEQIVQAGINLNSSNYNFFNFTFALATSSGVVNIGVPVAMPPIGGGPPVVGVPQVPIGTPEGVAVPDIVPVMLEIDADGDGEGDFERPQLPGGGGELRIPGVAENGKAFVPEAVNDLAS